MVSLSMPAEDDRLHFRYTEPELMTVSRIYSAFTHLPRAVVPSIIVAIAASAASASNTPPLFSNSWIIEASIEAPFKQIMGARPEEKEYTALFTYTDPAGLQQKLDIKLRVRGNYRTRKDICHFAPLRLNFKKKQVSDTEFSGQDKLKLVTHCDTYSSNYEQFLLKEYLSYRFLQELTEYAFHTRLLRVTYVDSEGKSRPRTKYAFLIEHREQMAERLGASVSDVKSIKLDQLDAAQTNLLSVFSYFIGNTDFSPFRGARGARCCHNVTLLKQENDLSLPVPYDFDLSGMVDAVYASPNPKLPITTVSKRLYRGWCKNNKRLDTTFSLFHDKRDNIVTLVANLEGINNYSRKKMLRYIDSFYKTLAKDTRIERSFVKACS